MSYQKRDTHIIEYKCYQFKGLSIRGPKIDTTKPYIVCIGAAQSFGPFCEKPFPALLADKLGIQVLNLGFGGATPDRFLANYILESINNSRLAIIQVLSGRCGSNSRYTFLRNHLGIRHDDFEVVHPWVFWEYAEKNYRKILLNKLVNEARRDYTYKMIALIQSVKVPGILFYISKCKPEELPVSMNQSPFPHLIKRWMIEEMAEFCDEYVECVSSRGLPMKFYDKNGNPTTVERPPWISHLPPLTHNNYYPSPEMHEVAASTLEPICRKILGRRSI